MKKYFLHNGANQEGPFDIDELRAKNISKDSSIWFEGQKDWENAENIDELKELFNKRTPPPFNKPQNKESIENIKPQKKKRNKLGVIIKSIGVIGVIALITFYFIDKNNRSRFYTIENNDNESYTEKVLSVEEIESSEPTNFLTAGGTYRETIFGDKIKINGVIKNNATVATYIDAVIKVTYLSKTKTVIGSNNYKIYKVFPPNSEVPFELLIKNYSDVETIGWDVIEAIAN